MNEAWRHDEPALVAALRAGDEEAFGWLLDTLTVPLRRLARTFVRTDAAAEDVVQETWLAVIAGIDRFEGRSTVRTWVGRILVNQARRRGTRDARSTPFSSLGPADEPAVDPEAFLPAGHVWAGHWAAEPADWASLPAARLEAAETLAVVGAAIDALPAVARQVIVLRDVEGWPGREVAEELGLTDANVRVLLHRSRAKVRRALDAHLSDPSPEEA